MIEYLGVALINIWCVAGILSSFVLLALRNGTYDQFNRKYPAITPFVLLLCVVISLQICWRAYHHSYLFQMVRNPSYLYIECTYYFWLSKAIRLMIQTVGCTVYYMNPLKKNKQYFMEWMLRLNQTCSTFAYILIIYFGATFVGIVDEKNTEQCWNMVLVIQALVECVLPLLWNIYDTENTHSLPKED